jgi:2-haloacid dehalogenase
MKPELVVFDIGNVLIEWQPERTYSDVFGADRAAAFFRDVPIHRTHLQLDAGARFSVILDLIEDFPVFEPEIRFWVENWSQLASRRIEGSIRLMRALQAKGVPVWALTNFGDEPFDVSCADHPFLTEFDGAVVSGRIGLIKPDPAIYEALEDATMTRGARILFTDDRPENIDAARARRWQVHLFEGPQGWADRLVAAGLLTAEEAAA